MKFKILALLSIFFFTSCASITIDKVKYRYSVSDTRNIYIAYNSLSPNLWGEIFQIKYLREGTVCERSFLIVKSINNTYFYFSGDGGRFISKDTLPNDFTLSRILVPNYDILSSEWEENSQSVSRLSDRRVVDGCLIQALNFQADLKKEDLLWTKILMVWYDGTGHAYCVFRLKNGNAYAYDQNGTKMISANRLDALTVAKELKPWVMHALYDL